MLPLKEFAKGYSSFPGLLNYFGFVHDGILLNKDGSLSACFYYSGPDMESSLGEEEDVLAFHINSVFNRFGTGWCINVDSIRIPAIDYPQYNFFTDATNLLVEKERKKEYINEGNHYETIFALTVTYRPNFADNKSFEKFFINTSQNNNSDLDSIIDSFIKDINEFESDFSSRVLIKRMDSSEMMMFLHNCITSKRTNFPVPEVPVYISNYLGAYDFIGGTAPVIDDCYINVVGLINFPNESYSGMLNVLSRLPFEYRFSSRFILMDMVDAERKLKSIRTKLHNKQIDLFSLIADVISPGGGSKYSNREAIHKAIDADDAVTEAQEGIVKYGYYSSVIVIFDKDKSSCNIKAEKVRSLLENHGFPSRIERGNAVEAYLGSLPAHLYPNVRKPLINTLNFSHLIPLTSVWAGWEFNPCSYFPGKSSPLFYASSLGSTPFRFNLHVSDVGHSFVIGPTGSGKSTLISLICSSFFRYRNAQVFVFEKGMSQFALVNACGGDHYDILGDNEGLGFCPLSDVEKEGEDIWACDWIETLLELQGIKVDPKIRNDVYEAVGALKSDKSKTLSNLYTNVQNLSIKEALEPFIDIKKGIMSELLDKESDGLSTSNFQVFEIEKLMNKDDRLTVPILLYLFHKIEKRLNGNPTLIILDEAWLMLKHRLFSQKIEEWLRVLRKNNAAVVFATQSLSDIISSPLKPVIEENCLTKIFLPSPSANSHNVKPIYDSFGLNASQIDIISKAIPKLQYYYTSADGQRLIELSLGDLALCFLGVSNKEDIKTIKELMDSYGSIWPKFWIEHKGLLKESKEWMELFSLKDKKGG